ncbi:hypothetical protein J2T17_002619 [Paenibacillus mucilaginosus]|uniref:putative baseplate assembly protein n=1 Tax=Paenibacillus mucilaginosus TaxID=61624 RepID=UPI003D216CFA
MLPLPNLDDRTFEQILAEARKRISSLLPEWSDRNESDPGLTMLELLAWHTEMQQYYLNRVTEKQQRKFLKLAGLLPRPAVRARLHVHLSNVSELTPLPRGTPFYTLLGDTFETDRAVLLIPQGVTSIVVHNPEEMTNRSAANHSMDMSYFPFGEEANAGSKLFIGFDAPLPQDRSLLLTVLLHPPGALFSSPLQARQAEHHPLADRLEWSYYASAGDLPGEDAPAWLPLEVEQDETAGFSSSGRVSFRIRDSMQPLLLPPEFDRQRYWIGVTLRKDSPDEVPEVSRLHVNAVYAVHGRTLSYTQSYPWSGSSGESLESDHYLSGAGELCVQLRCPATGGWRELNRITSGEPPELPGGLPGYSVYRDSRSRRTVLTMEGDAAPSWLSEGTATLRLIACAASLSGGRRIGRSTGLPHQRLKLPVDRVLAEGLRLQVAEGPPEEAALWYDWERVEDFDSSGPDDRHYMLDEENAEIIFGNHDQGRIPPPQDWDHIAIVSCVTGGGETGNVKGHIELTLDPYIAGAQDIRSVNLFPAEGGADRETVADAMRRVRTEVLHRGSAVTDEDYEELALRITELRLARVKALPLYKPGMRDDPRLKAEAQMTLVLMPDNSARMPEPAPEFLRYARERLEPYRMITTELHVIGPAYIEITVTAFLTAYASAPHLEHRAAEALNAFLTPRNRNHPREGWTFGQTVDLGQLYAILSEVPGVGQIESLTVQFRGQGAARTREGHITIPRHGLVYSGRHRITISQQMK